MNAVAQRVLTDLAKSLDGQTLWSLANRAEKADMTIAAYLLATAQGQKPRKPQARKRSTASPIRRSMRETEEARLIRVGVSNTAARVLAAEMSKRSKA